MDITVSELKQKRDNNEDFLLIDVREQHEYEEFNLGGQLIPLGDLQGKIDDLDEWTEKEVIIHCRSGVRSAAAKAFMLQNGFSNVRNLEGGVLAWIELFGSQ